jgi:hypothetical protein
MQATLRFAMFVAATFVVVNTSSCNPVANWKMIELRNERRLSEAGWLKRDKVPYGTHL